MTIGQLQRKLTKLSKEFGASTPVMVVRYSNQVLDDIDEIEGFPSRGTVVVWLKPYMQPQHTNHVLQHQDTSPKKRAKKK